VDGAVPEAGVVQACAEVAVEEEVGEVREGAALLEVVVVDSEVVAGVGSVEAGAVVVEGTNGHKSYGRKALISADTTFTRSLLSSCIGIVFFFPRSLSCCNICKKGDSTHLCKLLRESNIHSDSLGQFLRFQH